MSLKTRLAGTDILVAPGVYDGLTASLATQAGFEALYLSGAAVAYTRLGRPDIGLTTASEMADTMALIAEVALLGQDASGLILMVTIGTGIGGAAVPCVHVGAQVRRRALALAGGGACAAVSGRSHR